MSSCLAVQRIEFYVNLNKSKVYYLGQRHYFLLYLSVSTRGVIGPFCRMYFTVRPAKFESFLSRAAN